MDIFSFFAGACVSPMLSRFFDPKNEPADAAREGETESKLQGSLLDLFDEAPSVVPSDADVSSEPVGVLRNGSLLSDIANADEKAERDLKSWIAAQTAEAEKLRQSKVAKPQAMQTNIPSRESQLELLAEELKSIRSEIASSRNRGEGQQNVVEKVAPQKTGAASHAPSIVRQVISPFSFERVIGALLRAWKWMLLGAVAGGGLAAMVALSMPNTYESIAEILIEPRGLRVLDNSVTPNELNSEATVAYAESQVSIIRSLSVLDPVITDLKLSKDGEFNGQTKPNGLVGRLVAQLFSNKSRSTDTVELAREYLQENLVVSRVNQTFAINIGVTTESPEKSRTIANAIARSYIADESGARSSAAKNASEDLLGRLSALRKLVQTSEEVVEQYKADKDLIVAGGQLVSETQLSRLNEQLATAQVQTGEARTRANQARKATASDIISGALPSSLSNSAVTQLRSEYAKIKARSSTLAVKLGARHPKRVAAAVELRSMKSSITNEIRRMISTAKQDYNSARSREANLISKIGELKSVVSASAYAMVKLREMEREVLANRKVYEAFLERSREVSELENIRSESARLISVAALPLKKKGPNRKILVVSGVVLGGGLGGLLGLIPFLFGGMRNFVRRTDNSDTLNFQGDLYTSEPAAPQPAIYSNWVPQPAENR